MVPINSGLLKPLFEFDGDLSTVMLLLLLLLGADSVLVVGNERNVEWKEVVEGGTVDRVGVSDRMEEVGATCVEVGAAIWDVDREVATLFAAVYHPRINLCPQQRP